MVGNRPGAPAADPWATTEASKRAVTLEPVLLIASYTTLRSRWMSLRSRWMSPMGRCSGSACRGLKLRLSQGRFCSGEVLRRQDVGDRLEWSDGLIPLMLVSSMGS